MTGSSGAAFRLAGLEEAPECRLNAEHRKEVAGDKLAIDHLALAAIAPTYGARVAVEGREA
jgi:hypothetical protein